MTTTDPLGGLEALVRERMRAALADKAAFEREGQRLNSQLMQGEVNMATAVLGWIERLRLGAEVTPEEEEEAAEES
jgi:hypothetical protein